MVSHITLLIILKNNLNIVYHVEDLKVNFVLSAKDDTVFNIFKKKYDFCNNR